MSGFNDPRFAESDDDAPDEAPDLPTDEPQPVPVQDPPAEPDQAPYVVGALESSAIPSEGVK